MAPRLPQSNQAYEANANAEFFRYIFQRAPIAEHLTYLNDILFSEFRVYMLRPLSTIASSLALAIGAVVGRGAKKQVPWIDTRRVVAFMADVEAIADGAVGNLPRYPVGHLHPINSLNTAIPVGDPVGVPFPARIDVGGDIDLDPEPRSDRLGNPGVLALARAVCSRLPVSVGGWHWIAAGGAYRSIWGRLVSHGNLPSFAAPRDVRSIVGAPLVNYPNFITKMRCSA